MRMVVVLPHPDGPRSTRNSWSRIVRLRSLTPTNEPQRLERFSSRISAISEFHQDHDLNGEGELHVRDRVWQVSPVSGRGSRACIAGKDLRTANQCPERLIAYPSKAGPVAHQASGFGLDTSSRRPRRRTTRCSQSFGNLISSTILPGLSRPGNPANRSAFVQLAFHMSDRGGNRSMVQEIGSAVNSGQPFAPVVTPAAVTKPISIRGPCTTGSPGFSETEKLLIAERAQKGRI